MTDARPWAGAVGALVAFGLPLALSYRLGPAGLEALSLWAITAIAAVGLNLTLGYAGQVSLAQGAFVGIGAYVGQFASAQGLVFGQAIAAAGVAAAALGVLLGWPVLRKNREYLPFATLAFAALAALAFRQGGLPTGDARPLADSRAYFQLCLALLAAASLVAWWILRSPWGRAFRALDANPVRAESLGVSPGFYATAALAIGAGLAGVAGSLLAPLAGGIDPGRFGVAYSVELLLLVVVGGSGRFFGPFAGAAVAALLPAWLGLGGTAYLIGLAILAVLVLAVAPAGAMGWVARLLPASPGEEAR